MRKQLADIANWLGAKGQHMENVVVTGASIDTRTISEGELFIPFRGEHVNGHRFVQQAIEKGAAASLWLLDEPNPPADIPLVFVEDGELALQQMARSYRDELTCMVIGVTGSNGKTSTKDLIASVLSPYFQVRKTEGNFNNELGLPMTLLSLDPETEVAVLEMGMSGFGEISFLSHLAKPHYAVITNIGEAHLQDLGSREGIAKAKFEIIDGFSKDGILFYDGDEPLLRDRVAQVDIHTVSFGTGKEAAFRLVSMDSGDEGSKFSVEGVVNGDFTIPVYGSHQVKNALAAILIAHELGLTNDQIAKALRQARLTDMRMQPILHSSGALFINDAYNAAPTSMRAAIRFLQETHLRNEKWIVLGDMLELGDDERLYHESLADDLATLDVKGICLFGPRMKWLYDVLQKQGKENRQLIWSETDYESIAEPLRKVMNANSIILLKGSRGMELERVVESLLEQ
ncbi:UDP-N-acetylmuramoyl-tripeptide--D-alanyl-D-alanine ligase [Sporosarcina cyprini]|uniref:UDP-N-acetylmuramoyl-tripeptide--D-alanyl-D- alanine ligase n=1 Tax=Sporosarcina cyprini TaxID=2910523 RepID=UPI001EDCF896|nr:UDP-N-acetylmuramoyl-tripeptide--D-alanyl-D-alanine ligase [Sporosarcina cyprini]MCG3086735.1 UDP-N-acetylmuramoyl-tripeptide--D-alanyl-D-alanine ligase [Sporosarcina cyprini]